MEPGEYTLVFMRQGLEFALHLTLCLRLAVTAQAYTLLLTKPTHPFGAARAYGCIK